MWMVWLPSGPRRIESEAEIRDLIRRGDLRAETPVQRNGVGAATPAAREFGAMFTSNRGRSRGTTLALAAAAALVFLIFCLFVLGAGVFFRIVGQAGVVGGAFLLVASLPARLLWRRLRAIHVGAIALAGVVLTASAAIGWIVNGIRRGTCTRELAYFSDLQAQGALTYERQGIFGLRGLLARSADAELRCEALRMPAETAAVHAIRAQIIEERNRGEAAERRYEEGQRGARSDPQNAAAAIPADLDDASDLRARCAAFRQRWMQLYTVDPIVSCDGPQPGHQGIKIIVTESGWESVGNGGTRAAFATAAVEAFKPHWAKYHAWTGADPEHHLVGIWSTKYGGLDVVIVATGNATGAFAESP